ncbi:MAG: hypothetical protein ACK4IK_09460 [Bacteroidia bacterium]
MKYQLIIIILIFFTGNSIGQTEEIISSAIEKNNQKKYYFGVTAGNRFSYMNSNIDWADIYNNYCYKCKVGYYNNGYDYYINLANYEEKELIQERNFPSYTNKGFNIGLNYLAQFNPKSNFYYDVSLNYVDQGKYYYSLSIFPASGTSGKHLYTFLPLVYYIAEIKTIDMNFKINYNIKVFKDKISLMPNIGLNRSHILHTQINAYEFEGNRYIGKFKREYYKDKYYNPFSKIIFDRAYQLNSGLSLNVNVKQKTMLMLNYTLIRNNIKIWKTMLKGENVGHNGYNNGYMLLHNAERVKINYRPLKKAINVIELKIVYKI